LTRRICRNVEEQRRLQVPAHSAGARAPTDDYQRANDWGFGYDEARCSSIDITVSHLSYRSGGQIRVRSTATNDLSGSCLRCSSGIDDRHQPDSAATPRGRTRIIDLYVDIRIGVRTGEEEYPRKAASAFHSRLGFTTRRRFRFFRTASSGIRSTRSACRSSRGRPYIIMLCIRSLARCCDSTAATMVTVLLASRDAPCRRSTETVSMTNDY